MSNIAEKESYTLKFEIELPAMQVNNILCISYSNLLYKHYSVAMKTQIINNPFNFQPILSKFGIQFFVCCFYENFPLTFLNENLPGINKNTTTYIYIFIYHGW